MFKSRKKQVQSLIRIFARYKDFNELIFEGRGFSLKVSRSQAGTQSTIACGFDTGTPTDAEETDIRQTGRACRWRGRTDKAVLSQIAP